MKLTNIISLFIISLLMVGCGGGSGDSSSSDPVVKIVEEPVVEPHLVIVEPDPNAIYATTAELIASKSFLFEQEYELAINYKNDDNRNVYLSVCSDFSDEEDWVNVNYNSCLLRTSIEGDYAGTVIVANDKHRLVMAVWYFDDPKNPRYVVWENDGDAKGANTFNVN